MANIENYLSSIETKLNYAKFHHDQALFLLDKNNHLGAEAEFTAMMATLHTCLDMLAQIINANTNKNKGKIYFTEKLIQTIPYPDLREKCMTLKKSTIYLSSFVNVSKHRNLIKCIHLYSLVTLPSYNYKTIVESFSYNDNTKPYPETDILEVINREYEPFIKKMREIIKAFPGEWLK